VLEVQEAARAGWPPLETVRLGGWLLRAAGGFTGRANSVLPLGDPPGSLADALAAASDWYGERRLPLQVQVPLPVRATLDAALAERGWTAHSPALVLTADSADVDLADRAGRGTPVEVQLEPNLGPQWLAAYRWRGGDLPPTAEAVLRGTGQVIFASARDADGLVLGIARGSVQRGRLGLHAVQVVEQARRQGVATAMAAALLDWGRRAGAASAYLEVMIGNDPALRLWRRAGFAEHHRYHYRRPPPPDDG